MNLFIPEHTSLSFDIKHTGSDGQPVDHSQSTVAMAAIRKDKTAFDMSGYCSGYDGGIRVVVPAEFSDSMPIGKYPWDMIVTTAAGDAIRMAYGKISVTDSYAMD